MFKERDRVKCINASDTRYLANNSIYTVGRHPSSDMVFIEKTACRYFTQRFELYKEPISYPTLRRDYV